MMLVISHNDVLITGYTVRCNIVKDQFSVGLLRKIKILIIVKATYLHTKDLTANVAIKVHYGRPYFIYVSKFHMYTYKPRRHVYSLWRK